MTNKKIDIGYCSNVHAGVTIDQVCDNLRNYAVAVKEQVSPDAPLPIGLWLSSTATAELATDGQLSAFSDFLNQAGLLPFTINGFPFGDFHQPVVKHQVYQPTWAEPSRLEFTLTLARIQNEILPAGRTGTISTLPIGWPINVDYSNKVSRMKKFDGANHELLLRGAKHLQDCASELARLESETGRRIVVCLEPEPGCLLDNATDVELFFKMFLLNGLNINEEQIRKHIGICHDVCHSAVMFEKQADAISVYRKLGLTIGKIQVSSAIDIDFDVLTPDQAAGTLDQLRSFAEPKYLHQTTIQSRDSIEYFEDLPAAIERCGESPGGNWRVHFHVPIFADRLGVVTTSQSEIVECLSSLRSNQFDVEHFEIETYAWNAIPESLRNNSLADDIAREISWFRELVATNG